MKNKIIISFACILLITLPVLSVAGNMNNIETTKKTSVNYNDLMQKVTCKGYLSEEWLEQDKLTASDGIYNDQFAISVSIDCNYAIIGTSGDASGTGSAYIFKRTGSVWTEQQKLLASDGASGDFFGMSVSINGDSAIAGAPLDDNNTGSAYIFKRNGTTWIEEQKLLASDGASGDFFGMSVSINGDSAIVGAPYDDNNTGSAYVFKHTIASDLDCDGTLSWTNVKPGATATGTFTVENIGEPLSLLDWEIESYPNWGTFTFDPTSGINLTPEDGAITINVEVTAPDETETKFSGEIKIVNSENPDDFCIIDVSLATPVSQQSLFLKCHSAIF